MRLIVIAAAFCLGLPLVALSVEPVPYDENTPLPVAMTYCIPGEGCLTCDSEMPRAAVNDLLDLELAEGEVLLFTPDAIRPDSDDWTWKATGLHFPSVVEAKLSGRANRDQPPACAHRAALKGSHQPKDGTWESKVSSPVGENCPAGMPSAPAQTSRSQGNFDRPFRGRLSAEESTASIIQVSPNTFMSQEPFGDRIARTILQVKSPTRIEIYFAHRAVDPGNPCILRFTVEMDFVGNG